MNTRLIGLLSAALLIAGLNFVGPAILPHWVRAALFAVIETGDPKVFDWAPGSEPRWTRSDPPELFAGFRAEAEAASAGASTQMAQCVSLMRYTRSLQKRGGREWVSSVHPEQIRSQMALGRVANCSHLSRLLMSYLRSLGRNVRIVNLDGLDRMGGAGHTVVEVWVEPRGKWVLLDPLHSACFTSRGVPLSLMEIRDLIFRRQEGRISAHTWPGGNRFKGNLLDSYAFLINNITQDGAGNLISRDHRPYGFLSPLSPLISRLPRLARSAIKNMMGTWDVRIHYLDLYASPYFPQRFVALLRGIALLLLGYVTALAGCWFKGPS